MFLHEEKLKKKLVNFKSVIVKKEFELNFLNHKELADKSLIEEQSKLFDKHINGQVKEELEEWAIPPAAVTFHEKVGEGAFGVVFKGIYRKREVALKTMSRKDVNETNLKRFVSETLLLARLHHPNVIGFEGCVLELNNLFIVIEYAGNGNLNDCLQSKIAETWTFHNHKLQVLREICKGISYLHCPDPVKIIHRDLKCDNILVTEHLHCKISDFGESRDLGSSTMSVAGTPLYMAPEVFRGDYYDESADVYSFAIIMCAVACNGRLDQFFSQSLAGEELEEIGSSGSGLGAASKLAFGWRPTLPQSWQRELPSLVAMITKCWHAAHAHRPSISQVWDMLDFFWRDNERYVSEMNGNRATTVGVADSAMD